MRVCQRFGTGCGSPATSGDLPGTAKAYWMVPVFVVLALVAVLLVVGQTVAPFIYTIF